jgi:prolyl-tRNA synthetase
VLVIAQESTETNSGAIGKYLNLKELRLASEDLIKSVLPSAGSKDDVSPLPLSSIPETLHLLIDQKLAESQEEHAVHLTASSSTVLIKGGDLKSYLESLQQGGEVKIVDFDKVKAEPRAPAAAYVPL